MKKPSLILIAILFFVCSAYAGKEALVTPKVLSPLEAHGIDSGFEVYANADNEQVRYSFYWLDSTGKNITAEGKQLFTCRDWDALPSESNEDCTALDTPYDCCTDLATGTCDDVFDNANCVGKSDPLECCTDVAEGACDCWNDIKSLFAPVKNFLDDEVDKWENIERQ